MRSRVLGAAAAVLLAIVGTWLMMTYVSGAEERAWAGVETTAVLVVTEAVPAGTASDVALLSVEQQELPAKAIAEGVVVDTASLAGQVTTVDLVPGEQLLSTRFAPPEEADAEAESPVVELPAGYQELSISLDAERTVGGKLAAGDTVGVFISIGNKTETGPTVTHLTLHKVLITDIQGGSSPRTSEDAAPEPAAEEPAAPTDALPSNALMFTLALTSAEAEKVVWGQEFGTIWLSLEPEDAVEDGTQQITRENVHQ